MPDIWNAREIRADGKVAASGAAQFMPFAALRGLADSLERKSEARVAQERHELTEDEAQELSRRLLSAEVGDLVSAEVYRDGRYWQVQGCLTRVALIDREIRIEGQRICIDDLRWMDEL